MSTPGQLGFYLGQLLYSSQNEATTPSRKRGNNFASENGKKRPMPRPLFSPTGEASNPLGTRWIHAELVRCHPAQSFGVFALIRWAYLIAKLGFLNFVQAAERPLDAMDPTFPGAAKCWMPCIAMQWAWGGLYWIASPALGSPTLSPLSPFARGQEIEEWKGEWGPCPLRGPLSIRFRCPCETLGQWICYL